MQSKYEVRLKVESEQELEVWANNKDDAEQKALAAVGGLDGFINAEIYDVNKESSMNKQVRYYFTDITIALYMAKNFGWSFYRHPHKQKHNLSMQTLALHLHTEARGYHGLNEGEKIYLKPEHYSDLKPQEGDFGEDGTSPIEGDGFKVSFFNRTWHSVFCDAEWTPLDEDEQEDCIILLRDNKQWFMPKQEVMSN